MDAIAGGHRQAERGAAAPPFGVERVARASPDEEAGLARRGVRHDETRGVLRESARELEVHDPERTGPGRRRAEGTHAGRRPSGSPHGRETRPWDAYGADVRDLDRASRPRELVEARLERSCGGEPHETRQRVSLERDRLRFAVGETRDEVGQGREGDRGRSGDDAAPELSPVDDLLEDEAAVRRELAIEGREKTQLALPLPLHARSRASAGRPRADEREADPHPEHEVPATHREAPFSCDARPMPPRSQPKPKRKPRLAELGALYAFPMHGGRFGACQVVGLAEDRAEIATLDGLFPALPSEAELRELPVLLGTSVRGEPEPRRSFVSSCIPWWVTRIGTRDVPRFESECQSFGGGWQVAFGALYAERAEREGRVPWRHDASTVSIDLGAGPRDVRRDTRRLDLGAHLPVPGHDVRFEALDVLPHLNELEYAGSDARILAYARARRLLRLTWRAHAQTRIDLRGHPVRDFHLEVGGADVELLFDSLDALSVSGRPERLHVQGTLDFPFHVDARSGRGSVPRGLEGLASLTLNGLAEADLEGLGALVGLKTLTLRGAPGFVRDARALVDLRDLRELSIYDVYDLDVDRFPAFEALDEATLVGVRKADAATLKKKLAHVPRLDVRKAKDDAFIAANVDNPLRDFADDDARLGAATQKLWKTTRERATKLGPDAPATEAEALLHDFVEALNRLHEKHVLDTVRREQAGEAVDVLAKAVGVAPDRASALFDRVRTF